MPSVFVSYSHIDRKWCDPGYPFALIPWLATALRRDGVLLWYDRSDTTGIQPGAEFEREILDAIDAAEVALLLISEAFFASDFIRTVELPRILDRAARGDLVVIPILLEPCDWHSFDYIATRQMLPGEPTPLIDFTDSDRRWAHARNQVLSGIRRRLHQQESERGAPPAGPAAPTTRPVTAAGALSRGTQRWWVYAGIGIAVLALVCGIVWIASRVQSKMRSKPETTLTAPPPTAASAKQPTPAPPEGDSTDAPAPDRMALSPVGLFADAWSEQFVWMPDGEHVVIGGTHLDVVDVAAGTVRRASTETVGDVTISSDGLTLVAAPNEGVTLWDVASWTRLRTLVGTEGARAIALRSDGGALFAAVNEAVIVADLAGDAAPDVIPVGTGVMQLALSPDGTTFATGGSGLKVWDAGAGTLLKTLEERGYVAAIAFSPDGLQIAASGDDGSVRIWDVATGAAVQVLTGHADTVTAVAYSPDGTLIATGSRDLSVRLWDVATGTSLASAMGHTTAVARVAFSPDGATLASGAGNDLRLWSISTAEGAGAAPPTKRAAPGPLPTPVPLADDAITPANAAILTQSGLFEGYVQDFTWSPDGATVVIGGSHLDLYDVASGATRRASTETMGIVRIAPDGATLFSAVYGGITVWNMATTTRLDTLPDSKNARVVALSPDGTTLIASAGEALKAWDLASGAVYSIVPAEGYLEALTFLADGQTIAGCGGPLRFWDVATLVLTRTEEGQPDCRDLAASPDGRLLAVAGRDGTRVWDLATARPLQLLAGHTGTVTAVAFAPDSQVLATGGEDATVRLWDVTTGEALATLIGHNDDVERLAFSPDGRLLASGAYDSLRLWQAQP